MSGQGKESSQEGFNYKRAAGYSAAAIGGAAAGGPAGAAAGAAAAHVVNKLIQSRRKGEDASDE